MSVVAEASWVADNWVRVIVALASTGTFGIAVRFYAVRRKGQTDDLRLDVDGDAKIREHYETELKALREQIIASGNAHAERAKEAEARYRDGLRAADDRHNAAMLAADEREAQCQALVKTVREEVRELSDEIIGLRRQLIQSSRSAMILATHAPSEDIQESADRAVVAVEQLDARTHKRSEDDRD